MSFIFFLHDMTVYPLLRWTSIRQNVAILWMSATCFGSVS